MTLMPLPRSTLLTVLNLAFALIVGAIGFGVGFAQGQLAQTVVVFTVITVAALFWFANYVAVAFENRRVADAESGETDADRGLVGARSVWAANRVLIVAMALLLLAYLIITATVPPFRTLSNLIAFLVLEAILVFAFKVSGVFVHGRSAFIGLIVLIALVVISAFTIEGFLSATNIKAVLLFASFLGIACAGQTLVALMGGLDLSIPFVIGAANIGLLYLIGLGVPPWFAFALVIIIGGLIGFVNGVMSYKLQGQALIMTLGMGFAVAGLVQIITSIGSQFSGNVFGTVPPWLSNIARRSD
jgi:ribose transport system permease protein